MFYSIWSKEGMGTEERKDGGRRDGKWQNCRRQKVKVWKGKFKEQ